MHNWTNLLKDGAAVAEYYYNGAQK